MNKRISSADLLKIIDRALDEQGISARQASILATGTPELIRNMRRGRVPSVERFLRFMRCPEPRVLCRS